VLQIDSNDCRRLFNGKRLSTRSRFQTERGAFTLTEMLVVIVIIIVLALLSFTAYRKSVAVSQQTICASNMRQLYQAILFYGNDNNGILIPCLQYYPTPPGVGLTWEGYLVTGGYIISSGTIQAQSAALSSLACPVPVPPAIHSGSQYTGYGMNSYLSPYRLSDDPRSYVHIRDIHNPSQRFLLIDNEEYATWGYPGAFIDYRHSGGANLCFMDGHVEWWKTPIVNPPPGPPYPYPW
jgi:prepilin-type processing-associated H-X9-DG protein